MIGIESKADFKKTKAKLERLRGRTLFSDLDRYGQMGVQALQRATPVDSSLTQMSWAYRVIRSTRWPGIYWYNTNMANETPVAILIQYGHATRSGGYVSGRDYINPAMRPVFDQIAADVWKKVIT